MWKWNIVIVNVALFPDFNRDVHSSITEGSEWESVIQPRSITEENLVAYKLRTIEKALKDIQDQNKKCRLVRSVLIIDFVHCLKFCRQILFNYLLKYESSNKDMFDFSVSTENNMDLIRRKSLGVHCSTCIEREGSQTEYPKNCKEIQRTGMHLSQLPAFS